MQKVKKFVKNRKTQPCFLKLVERWVRRVFLFRLYLLEICLDFLDSGPIRQKYVVIFCAFSR